MNLSYFISKRLNSERKEGISSSIHRIAIASIAVGVAASIVSFLILKGFQKTIRDKVYSFSGHILVTKFSMNNSVEETPMDYNIPLYKEYKDYGFIDHIQEYAHKSGLIKTDKELLGVIIKGIGKSFDVDRFSSNLVEGRFIDLPDSGYSQEILLSRTIANKIAVSVGDDITVFFFPEPIRRRRLHVAGIYETNLSEYFDDKVIIGDIRMIGRLNNWADSIAGGLEVYVKDIDHVDDAAIALGDSIDYDMNIETVSQKYSQVFEWLHLLSRQVDILMGIILAVVCVNMISVVLILVMERTPMIGLLKAMGASNGLIRAVFVQSGIRLMIKGLLAGNILGLGLCAIQYYFKPIPLNAHDYYMSFVPIEWQMDLVLMVNLITFVLVAIVLILPTAIIARISPIRAIRFD